MASLTFALKQYVGRKAMTVCIAAVCDGGKSIIVAADRMFTAPPRMNMEFETSEKKIEICRGLASLFLPEIQLLRRK